MANPIESIVEFFGSCPLTQALTGQEREVLAKAAVLLTVKAKDIVFWEGSKETKMYFVVSGGVIVSKKVHGNVEEVIARFSPGDHFGEIALVDEEPRSATVQAQSETVLLVLERKKLLELEKGSPELISKFYRALLKEMVQRLRKTDEKLLAAVLWGMEATSMGEEEIKE